MAVTGLPVAAGRRRTLLPVALVAAAAAGFCVALLVLDSQKYRALVIDDAGTVAAAGAAAWYCARAALRLPRGDRRGWVTLAAAAGFYTAGRPSGARTRWSCSARSRSPASPTCST